MLQLTMCDLDFEFQDPMNNSSLQSTLLSTAAARMTILSFRHHAASSHADEN